MTMDVINYFPKEATRALSNTGSDVIAEIGEDIIKDVVLNVLVGENIRDNTELLTRKRLLTLNAATLYMLIKGQSEDTKIRYMKKLTGDWQKKGCRNKKNGFYSGYLA
jgi:hypothetical protein